MGAMLSVGLSLIGLGIGVVLGWTLGLRRVDALRREHGQRKAELRSHVLPVLEERASAAGVPPDKRARDVLDPMLASIAIGRAIQELDAHRELPFTDTIEVSKDDISAEVVRRKRA